MGYVNLPPDLQSIFQGIENRVDKLENAQRFTLPNVPVPVTAATGNGATITYTARNNFLAGQTVTISGLGIASGASLNLANVIIASATASQFTVTNSTTGVSAGTGQAVAIASTISGLGTGDPAYPRIGDQWLNMANNTINYVDARGYLGQMFSTYALKASDSSVALSSAANTYQNVFGSTGGTVTLQPYRTYKIEALVSVSYYQSTTAAVSVGGGVYSAVANPWTWGQWVSTIATPIVDNSASSSWGNNVAYVSSTWNGPSYGMTYFNVLTTGVVRTGATAVAIYPFANIGGATISSVSSNPGCYMSVTSIGNSTNVQVGPWA
jgi:hypothetical protein